MVSVVVCLLLGLVLVAAAGLKLAGGAQARAALATYGVRGETSAKAVWSALIAVELGLGVAVGAGSTLAANAAALLMAGAATAQIAAILAGGTGAPCACFGANGKVGKASAGRAALLAAAFALLPVLPRSEPTTDEWQTIGLIGALLAIATLIVVVLALAREVGMLRLAVPQAGALEIAHEGPEVGAQSALFEPFELAPDRIGLAVFTSEGCGLCRVLAPTVQHSARTRASCCARSTRSSMPPNGTPPTCRAVRSRSRSVPTARCWPRGRSTAARSWSPCWPRPNDDAGQFERERRSADRRRCRRRELPPRLPGTGRRGGGGRDGRRRAGRPGGRRGLPLLRAQYTTDSCPHPTGLPRIDARGLPIRAQDGRPVDDQGRYIDAFGSPVDEDGNVLTDADGSPLPPTTRTPVCDAAADVSGFTPHVDGASYFCCGGRVRKLVDCCGTMRNRINGDKALKGYCFRGRKVFCVMYFQTKVRC